MNWLKSIGIGIITVSILGSALVYPLIYLDFSLRQDYIAKVLCIQKDKPNNGCNGHCYLAKKLKKAQEKKQEKKQTVKEHKFTFFYQEVNPQDISQAKNTESINWFSSYNNRFIASYSNSIFHPPQA